MSEVTATSTTTTTTDPAARRAARYSTYVFWLMSLATFFNYLNRYIFTGLSPYIKESLGLSDQEVGLLISGFFLVYTLAALPLGFLADRIARRAIVGAGVVLWSLGSVLTGFAGDLLGLVAAKILLGVGQGSFFPAGTPLLAAYYSPASRSRVIAQWSVWGLLGVAAGSLLAIPFASDANWRYAFFFMGTPGLLVALLIFFIREKKRHEEDPSTERLAGGTTTIQRIRAYLRIPTFRVILGMHIFGFFALTTISGFLQIYIKATYPQLPASLQLIFGGGFTLIGGILGNLYGSRWARRMSRHNMGARVRVGGLGFLVAALCVVFSIGVHYVMPSVLPQLGLDPSLTFPVTVGIFAGFALLAAFFLNVYNGPVSAALLDVIPPAERSRSGGTELTMAHLLGDSYAAFAVGSLSVLLGNVFGGEQIGLALLLTAPLALVLAGIIGIRGSRHYASDVAALGTTAEVMLGTVAAR